MNEVSYNAAELSNYKYVKVIYKGVDNKPHEVMTDVKTLNDSEISLYFKYRVDFDIKCPQEITVKFVTDDGMFVAKSTLKELEKSNRFAFMKILPPSRMEKRQERKYYRVSMKRYCVLIVTDENGNSKGYMSRLVDISAGGVLIHKLESMFNDCFVNINPDDWKQFNIVLFLDIDIVLKLSARFVRCEKQEQYYRYAFEFIKIKESDINIISKYVTKEQVEQLNFQQKLGKNSSVGLL